MKTLLKNLTILIFISCQHTGINNKKEFSLLHYNIKELDSTKITKTNKQLQYVKKIINQFEIDILSLNEVQYDFKNVPNSHYQTEGENIEFIKDILGLSKLSGSSFHPANTGMNATTKPDGTYYIRPHNWTARMHADPINFGTMPAQYSSGALFRFTKVNEKIITNLKWRDFNKELDLSKFKTSSGKELPDDMKLFDKNFSDITLIVDGRELHLILLHTVPAFGFGNKLTPNLQRNADQLRFLEWYLTGKTDFEVSLDVSPIAGESFIAVGDLNTDINDESKDGSLTLKSLFSKTNTWIEPNEMSFTNESSSFAPKPHRLMLDYIITSKNIDTTHGMIIHPSFERRDLGCNVDPRDIAINAEQKLVKYLDRNKKECFSIVDKNDESFKLASDHYPIYGKFKFNENY